MKLRDFIKIEQDTDIYDDVYDGIGICFCGALRLKKEGEPGYCNHGETFADPWDEVEYNGYWISHNIYGSKEYTVQYQGDDVIFGTVEEAKHFIDMVV